jgi:hypothetical protein
MICGTSEGGGRSRETSSDEEARYATQVTEHESLAEPPFEQPSH